MFSNKKLLTLLVCLPGLLMSGCSLSPNYVNEGDHSAATESNSIFDTVHYKANDSFLSKPPECIASLPVKVSKENEKEIHLNTEQLEKLHWNLYSHLSPYAYRDIELSKIKQLQMQHPEYMNDYSALAKALDCDAFLETEVTRYEADHFGFYSQSSVGVEMKLIRASNQEVLWEGRHIARSHGGAVPLTPIGLVEGVFSATENIRDEQMVKVEDELFRRLLSTWKLVPPVNNGSEQIVVVKNEEPAATGIKEKVYSFYVAVKHLFLRAGPGTSYEAKDVLNENDELQVVDEQHSPWLQVKDSKGQLGFVNEKYLIPQPSIN